MSQVAEQTLLFGRKADRADELFQQHQQEIYRRTDQLFASLMLVQWLAAILIAMIISLRTWIGQSTHSHIAIWVAISMGGAITIFPIWITRAWPGAAMTRQIVAIAQMLMSVLLIGLTGGRIESHFHVFGSLVILSLYRDWRVLISATIVVCLDDRYVQVNARLCDMVGYSEEELTCRTTSEITYRDDVKESKRLARQLLKKRARYRVEKRYVRKNGEVIWAARTACIIGDETGEPRSYLVMVEDITQRKNDAVALEKAKTEAERANHAKDKFLAALSHELRTPLTPVLMSAAALEQKPGIEPELRQQFGMMRQNVELEARLIDDLLDLTRVAHGKLRLRMSGPVDVHALLAQTEQIVRSEVRAKTLALKPCSGLGLGLSIAKA